MDSTIIAMATRSRNVRLWFDIALLLKGWESRLLLFQKNKKKQKVDKKTPVWLECCF